LSVLFPFLHHLVGLSEVDLEATPGTEEALAGVGSVGVEKDEVYVVEKL